MLDLAKTFDNSVPGLSDLTVSSKSSVDGKRITKSKVAVPVPEGPTSDTSVRKNVVTASGGGKLTVVWLNDFCLSRLQIVMVILYPVNALNVE